MSQIASPATPLRSAAEKQHRSNKYRRTRRTVGFHVAAGGISLLWALPLLLVFMNSFRTFDDIAAHGVASLPSSLSFDPYVEALQDGGLLRAVGNSLMIAVPTVAASLLLSSAAAFALSRYSVPFRRTILLVMLAGNLLPVQLLLIPVTKIAENLNVYDTLFAVIAIQTACGIGFYTFIIYGFMRGIPFELQDAAALDGAGPIRTFAQVILPLTRPALAALGALGFTWVFNDLLWSLTLLVTDTNFPVTASILLLKGEFRTDYSALAAATMIAALPCIIVFLVFQRSFIGGLALGAVK